MQSEEEEKTRIARMNECLAALIARKLGRFVSVTPVLVLDVSWSDFP